MHTDTPAHAVHPPVPTMAPGAIFVKTARGRNEIAQRTPGLSSRQRQVLILVDGVRPVQWLNKMLPAEEFVAIIDFLQRQDMIALQEEGMQAAQPMQPMPPQPVQQPTQPEQIQPPQNLSADPAQLLALKRLLSESARTYLGLLSADICRRIDLADGPAPLLGILGQWHMALRQSRHGGAYVGRRLRQIEAGFYGAALPAWPEQDAAGAAE